MSRTHFTMPMNKNQCLDTGEIDSTVRSLDLWSTILHVIAVLSALLIAGIGTYLSFKATQSFVTFLKTVWPFFLYAFISYASSRTVSLILSALSKIVMSTTVNAKAALIVAQNGENRNASPSSHAELFDFQNGAPSYKPQETPSSPLLNFNNNPQPRASQPDAPKSTLLNLSKDAPASVTPPTEQPQQPRPSLFDFTSSGN